MSDFNIVGIPSQKGRIAVVTGANTGLGFETTRGLVRTRMKVIMACRNIEKGEAAKQSIISELPAADLQVMTIDLSRLTSVREFAATFRSRYDRLDLLINNAGIMVPPYAKTEDGFESQIGVNYFAHFLLTGLLFRTISGTPGARIVALASNAHRNAQINFDDLNWEKGYSRMKAYGQSKLACLIFAFELQRRIQKAGLKTLSVAAHPGVSITELVRNIPAWLMFIGRPVTSLFTHSPEKGALPALYAALSEDIKGGEYIGPQGPGERTGEPGMAKASAISRDETTGKRLWEVSEKLTGVSFP